MISFVDDDVFSFNGAYSPGKVVCKFRLTHQGGAPD